jgi:hypothetical protein
MGLPADEILSWPTASWIFRAFGLPSRSALTARFVLPSPLRRQRFGPSRMGFELDSGVLALALTAQV